MRVLGIDPGLTRCGVGVVEGRPARPPRLVAVEVRPAGKRPLGRLAGKFPSMSLEEFNADDEEIAKLFLGRDL